MKIVTVLNYLFNVFLYILAFLAVLSFQVKLLSLTRYYDIVANNLSLGILGLCVFSLVAIILSRLLIQYLGHLQQQILR